MSDLQTQNEPRWWIFVPTLLFAITMLAPWWYWAKYCCQGSKETQQHRENPTATGGAHASDSEASSNHHYANQEDEQWPQRVMAFATVAYVLVSVWMLISIRVQINQAKDTAQRQLRAYVCVHESLLKFPHVGIESPVHIPIEDMPNILRHKASRNDLPPGRIEAQIHFKNCGQTPAYDVRMWIRTWFGAYPLEAALPKPPKDFRMSSAVLGPGGKTIMISPEKPELTKEQMNLLGARPEYTMYIYGQVAYRDAFGKDRFTNYSGPRNLDQAIS
jgi:hypothetical protein